MVLFMNIIIDDKSYEVLVTKKNNKNLYIRLDDDLNIKVSSPYFYTNKMIENILIDNKDSIRSMIDKKLKINNKKIEEENRLLGKNINILYKSVSSPKFDGNTLIIKDNSMKDKWYKKKAMEIFKIYLDEAYYVFDEKIPYPSLKIRNMKTRWGVANRRDNSITLNLELIKKDQKYLNYVIIHELSHFVHFNHSIQFWKTVEKYCPEYKKVRKELKE